jgi:hypothetical protein
MGHPLKITTKTHQPLLQLEYLIDTIVERIRLQLEYLIKTIVEGICSMVKGTIAQDAFVNNMHRNVT